MFANRPESRHHRRRGGHPVVRHGSDPRARFRRHPGTVLGIAKQTSSPTRRRWASPVEDESQADVRFWHLVDISGRLGACPLSWVKRTSPTPALTSANDPEAATPHNASSALTGGRVGSPARVAFDATIFLGALRDCQTFSLRWFHKEDKRYKRQRHPTDKPK